ncbi:response regulator [Pseudodesulfovibrio piezophilus]|uniref:Sensory/regulatory protein RpfC n=1 Tax=Pseudodesulfovibrio piezophilus (strain DSM 21447 / JCM 15486 / C1TLV30) TaxID=1322246 RepID=M1WJC7_PSEP2|nr:response regulator [Pseudodesulfovibrio piezophilus]CCH47666.1 PAS/PAC sensor hybrid histidine kinase [Pseudodesulfovibrio piezophilus C1TLV30]
MAALSLRHLVQRNLTNWMLIPSICLILSLGAYAAYEKSHDFEIKNTILTQSLSKHITAHLNDAKVALASLSTSITRYDPFWFHWVLSNFLQAYPHFERLVYLDAKGKILATSPQASELISMENFIDKVSLKPTIISEPTPSPATQNLVVYVGIQLQNGNILIGELSLSSLQKHLENLLPEGEGSLILCDHYGNLISHPDFKRVIIQDNIGNLSILKDFESGSHLTSIYQDDDTYYLGTVSQINQTSWLLLISKPIQEVFLPILSPLLALLTIILCLFFMFAHYLRYRLRESIIKPLAHFTESIELTAQGQYRKPNFEQDSFSELAIIEQEFDEMVKQVNLREQEIKENEERFRQLVENIHEAYWINDIADNRIVYVSPSYEIIWGRPRESLYDDPESFFLAIDVEDRLKVIEAFNSLRSEGRILDEEFRILLPDGKTRWIRAQSFPVYDDEGVRVRIVGVAEDITERKAIQTALVSAKMDAETASQAKTEFLTNMSHELRTPLNGILGMLQLSRRTSLNKEQADYIETAISSSKVLLNVINDILNIAQIEAGRLALHPQLFSIHDVMETIFKFFKHSSESKKISLSMKVESDVPEYLIGDEIRIRQILFNLVGNSVKFTDEGSIHIHAQVLPIQRTQGMIDVLFMISDSGIGIPSEKIAYVFESFTQVDGTYTRRYQGTGLGLGIVRSLVDYMNGSITVDSESGEGTTMYVSLQLALPSHDQKTQVEEEEEEIATTRKLSILVVEDDRVNQIAISRMLEKIGHQATCVGDGKKALATLVQAQFDCIFMDIQMPIMDGIEATKMIRNDKKLADVSTIPIVALTAHAMPEDRENFLRVGMNDYISKPVSFEQLAAALKRLTTHHIDIQ